MSANQTTTITLPEKDYQNLQRMQNGGFSGNDPFWTKQSGEEGFITWLLRMAVYLMRQGKFYPLLNEVKKEYQREEES